MDFGDRDKKIEMLKFLIGKECGVIASMAGILNLPSNKIQAQANFFIVLGTTQRIYCGFYYSLLQIADSPVDLYKVSIEFEETFKQKFQILFWSKIIKKIHIYSYPNYLVGNIFQFDFEGMSPVLIYPEQMGGGLLSIEFNTSKIEKIIKHFEMILIETIF